MPRFVLLRHETPPGYVRTPHFDFLLEAGEVCRTWAIEKQPQSGEVIPCEALADHRTVYLDYEGELTGGRGSVSRVDHGTFQWLTDQPNEIVVLLAGERMIGRLTLTRELADGTWWQCRFTAE